MKFHKSRVVATVVLCAFSASCAVAKRKEETYEPSREVIRVKSDTPIVRLWDRWEERGGGEYLVGGKDVVSRTELPGLLADDPSPEVVAKVTSSRKLFTVGVVAMETSLLTALITVLGSQKKANGDTGFSSSTTNALWIATGALAVGGGILLKISSDQLDNAQSLHNSRIWNQASRSAVPHSVELAIRMDLK